MFSFFKNKQLSNRKSIGDHAEKLAQKYLHQKGLKFQTKNFHSRFGEIDLIMKDKDTLVFIEVRCRKTNAQVSAIESISPNKIKKIQKTAQYYLQQLSQIPECRFDVVAITYQQNNDYRIDWIKNAF